MGLCARTTEVSGRPSLAVQCEQDYCLPIFNTKLYDRRRRGGQAGQAREGREEGSGAATEFVSVRIQLSRREFNRQVARPDNGLPLLSLGIEDQERGGGETGRRGRYKTASTKKSPVAHAACRCKKHVVVISRRLSSPLRFRVRLSSFCRCDPFCFTVFFANV